MSALSRLFLLLAVSLGLFASSAYAQVPPPPTTLTYIPGSWIGRVGKIGYRGLKAVKAVKTLDSFEAKVIGGLGKKGYALLSEGDDATRALLGLSRKSSAADFVAVREGGSILVMDAKGSEVAHGVEQIQVTVAAVVQKMPNAKKIQAALGLRWGQKLEAGYTVVGNRLHQVLEGGKTVPVTIPGNNKRLPVHIHYF